MQTFEPLVEPRPGSAYLEVPTARPAELPVARAVSHELEVTISGAGREMALAEFHDRTATTAFLVVVNGVILAERYLAGTRPEDRLLGFSATKSVLALLAGVAVRRGKLDLDLEVRRLVPELADSGYAGVTARHLLSMTSGVRWVEDYRDPAGPAARLLQGWRGGRGGTRTRLTEIAGQDPPGSRYAYCSPDSLVLDWVRERATGQSFAEALGELLDRVGAERPAVLGLDAPLSQGGIGMAAGGLALCARDWARIGMLQVDGNWRGTALVDPEWVEQSSRPSTGFLEPGRLPSTLTGHAGFGYHWWPLDVRGTRVMADGMRGQLVYVDRPHRVVVVKTSAWPYDDPWVDRQCRDLSYLALPAVAEAAARIPIEMLGPVEPVGPSP